MLAGGMLPWHGLLAGENANGEGIFLNVQEDIRRFRSRIDSAKFRYNKF
jgi:hypothetical protein